MGNHLPLWQGILAVVLISAVFFTPRLIQKACADRPQPRRLARRVPQEVKTPGKDPLLSAMTPSLLGIAVCVVCLCGLSWAWFTVDIDSAPNTMTAANHAISVRITASGTDVTDNEDGTYTLSPKSEGNGYSVTITATGTASKGYCRLSDSASGDVYYAPVGVYGSTFTFTLYPEAGDYTFEAVWGTPSGGVILGEAVAEVGSPSDLIGMGLMMSAPAGPATPTDTESTDSESTDTESTGSESTDTESTGSESTGSESTDTESTDSESTGSESTGSDSTGSDSTGGGTTPTETTP